MKRIFIFALALVLILTAVHASALEPETVADLYNDYAAIFSAPSCAGIAKADDRFIQFGFSDGTILILSADLSFVTVVSANGEAAYRASVTILCALSDVKSSADIILGVSSAFLMLDAQKMYSAGGFSCRFEITTAGEYHFSAVKL